VRALYLLTPLASQPLDIPAPLIPRDRTGCSYNLARSVTEREKWEGSLGL
jgi:hypothetical protein